MASLFFLVRFLSGEIIMVIEQHCCWWDSTCETGALSCQIQMLKRCSEYPTITSLSQKMSYAVEVCNSEHGCRSHPNYFRLHIDAERCMWKTNLETKFLPLVRRGLKQANKHVYLPKWVGSVTEWEPLRNTDSASHTNNTFCGVFLWNLTRFEITIYWPSSVADSR